MNHSGNGRKRSKPKAMPGSDYGLNRRVSQKLGVSESLVSCVKRGVSQNPDIIAAIQQERHLMREEQLGRIRQAEQRILQATELAHPPATGTIGAV